MAAGFDRDQSIALDASHIFVLGLGGAELRLLRIDRSVRSGDGE